MSVFDAGRHSAEDLPNLPKNPRPFSVQSNTTLDVSTPRGKKQKLGPAPDSIVETDGRKCLCCGQRDTDIDPVSKSLGEKAPWRWGYPPRQDSKGVWRTSGSVCGYCRRTWEARYKHKTTITKLVLLLGRPGQEREKFHGLLAACIDFCIEKGSHDCRIGWDVVESKMLTVHEQVKTSIIEPEDEVWGLEYYKREHGDHESNGKGHRLVLVEGEWGVLVPSPPIRSSARHRGVGIRLKSFWHKYSPIFAYPGWN